jgi:RNA polymerase sigma-70 factor (ECF subfamily)
MDPGLNMRPSRARFSENGADLALLERIADGDRNALRDLYNTYYHPLLRFIYRITGRLELAQEGVNDVMLVVWRSSRSFGGRSSVSTWIMGIAYRKALKLLASSRRWTDRFMGASFEDVIERSDASAEQSDDGDLRDLLDEALRHLSAEHRAVVELTYFYGCSYEEIATIAACPVNTVKTRMFHARAKLKKLLPALGKDVL